MSEANLQSGRPRRLLWIGALVVALAGLFLGLWALLGSSEETNGPLRGLRLGYATSMARARFEPGAPGSYRSESVGEDLALVWVPEGDAGEVREARLEFHLGQLVAVYLTVGPDQPEAQGPEIAISGASVLTRDPVEDGVRVRWIARSCPTHAEEVERLISQRR